MKTKILEALKAKYEGVNEQVLSRIADKLAKTATTEEGVQPAVDGVTFQQILDAEADRRATEATQSAVTNYEKKHGLKDGQKVQTGGGTEKDDPGKTTVTTEDGKLTPESLTAAIKAAMKPIEDKLSALETEKLSGTRKSKLDAVIKELPEGLKKPYGRVTLKDMSEEEFDMFITETTEEVKGLVTEVSAKGAAFSTPLGGGPVKKEASKEEAAEIVAELI
jgi:peptidoglycan hydrolase-like protein with peptidoglycan-binding domain